MMEWGGDEGDMSEATVTSQDARYDDLFEIEKETEAFGTHHIEDPYPVWTALAARAPVHKGSLAECMGLPAEWGGAMYQTGFNYYSAFSYAAVSDAYTRKDDFSSEFLVDMGVVQMLGDSIFNMDGLRHRRYRDVVQSFFQPAYANAWWREKVILSLADELISSFEKDGRADLNAQFFSRLPMHTVTVGFGMSPEDGLAFRYHIQRIISHVVPVEGKAASMREVISILEPIIRDRQAEPKDDIISKLAHANLAEEDGSTRRLTVEEIVTFCRLIVFGGGGTTWRQLGITTFALLNDRDQFEAARQDRSLIGNAVLESVRWHTTDPMFHRKAIRDTTLQGVDIPKGAVVHLCLGSANRDPARWDNPDAFDIRRPMQRSMAFGAGHHSCLGQHVARQEIVVALNALFDRFPNMRWDSSKPAPKIMGGLIGRGPGPLHVVLN